MLPPVARSVSGAFRLFRVSLVILVGIQLCHASVLRDVTPGRSTITTNNTAHQGRERIRLHTGWRFWRSESRPDNLAYDTRPDIPDDDSELQILKPWILPTANDFIDNSENHYERPPGNPGENVSFVQSNFDDDDWEQVKVPHDWAIAGPFYTGDDPVVSGSMGRLPVQGVAWYRRKIEMAPEDEGRHAYLDIDGAMSYAMVWINGQLVGGWPYGYNSFRLDLTPHLKTGSDNQLAIRLDNPNESARWYPGGGLYRNVWLTKVDPIHVSQYGHYITTEDVSSEEATVNLVIKIENKGDEEEKKIEVATDIHEYDPEIKLAGAKSASFPSETISLKPGEKHSLSSSTRVTSPKLWSPLPSGTPNLYVAVTKLSSSGITLDTYTTPFGIRTITYSPSSNGPGLLINSSPNPVPIRGVNMHHDLGPLGAAFNLAAARRQLDILVSMGCNAIRTSHNPPAPEFLDLADSMGFLVLDEIFDSWAIGKTDNDFSLIFPEWHEADLRSFLRRDRNRPSVVAWSFGNEVMEQQTEGENASIGFQLREILRGEEDEKRRRPGTLSLNSAGPNTSFAALGDVISLNYQGQGIRDTPAYSQLSGTKRLPQFPAFRAAFPERLIWQSESASALSSRGGGTAYLFPVAPVDSAPVNETNGGGDEENGWVSGYELYSADYGSSADKAFAALDGNPDVAAAGEFVWTGFDYLGEPTPFDSSRSSYSGIVDLAGFKKDRFWLYRARWRPEDRFAHILPHWNWPESRVGEVTPVHVFSSADEAELFLNGASQGRKTKGAFEYRFRWDEVVYEPGELRVVAFKAGEEWAAETVRTTKKASQLRITADRSAIAAEGEDLAFVTAEVLDEDGLWVRDADDSITFSVSSSSSSGSGVRIVATDNGDPGDLVAFPSRTRRAFGGLALAVVQADADTSGVITVTAEGSGIESAQLVLETTSGTLFQLS